MHHPTYGQIGVASLWLAAVALLIGGTATETRALLAWGLLTGQAAVVGSTMLAVSWGVEKIVRHGKATFLASMERRTAAGPAEPDRPRRLRL